MKDFRTDYLRPIAEAFQWNLLRLSTYTTFPAWIALEALREQLWLDHANVNAGIPLNPDLFKFRSEGAAPKAAEEFNRLVEEYRHMSGIKLMDLLYGIGVSYIEHRLQVRGQQSAKLGIEALFSTVIIDSWTAFENLASDLWVVAVDKGPKEIASRAFLSKQLRTPEDQITPKTIHKLEHDLKEQPGSWLREVGKVSFQRLDDIKLFYAEVFGKDVKKLFDEVDGGYIVALSAFRNALIHNAGKADKKFLERVARFPEFRNIPTKEEFLLDGEVVARLRNAAINLGQKLIQFVDNQLTPGGDMVDDVPTPR